MADLEWCHAMWCDAMRCDVVKRNIYDILCDVIWSDIVWFCFAWSFYLICSALLCRQSCNDELYIIQLPTHLPNFPQCTPPRIHHITSHHITLHCLISPNLNSFMTDHIFCLIWSHRTWSHHTSPLITSPHLTSLHIVVTDTSRCVCWSWWCQ